MSIITKMLKQKAVYWAPSGPGQFGRTGFAQPVVLKCRWQDGSDIFAKAQEGGVNKEEVSTATVYVDRDVEEQGVLWLPPEPFDKVENEDVVVLAQVTNPDKPFENDGAREIKSFGKVPNLKRKEFIRTAKL